MNPEQRAVYFIFNLFGDLFDLLVNFATNVIDFLFTPVGSLINNINIPTWLVDLLIDLGAIDEMLLFYTPLELILGVGIIIVLVYHIVKFFI